MAALFATIPVGRAEAESTIQQIELYAATLSELPVWAIAMACRGHVESGSAFRPAAGELLKRGRAAAAAAQGEIVRIGQVLGARAVAEIGEEERARNVGKFKTMMAEALAPKPAQAAGEGAG